MGTSAGRMIKTFWRRGWDSNPRKLALRQFSRLVPSTARPPLQVLIPGFTPKRRLYDTIKPFRCQPPFLSCHRKSANSAFFGRLWAAICALQTIWPLPPPCSTVLFFSIYKIFQKTGNFLLHFSAGCVIISKLTSGCGEVWYRA